MLKISLVKNELNLHIIISALESYNYFLMLSGIEVIMFQRNP